MGRKLRDFLLALGLALIALLTVLGGQHFLYTHRNDPGAFLDVISTFTTIFLGIFIEAAPFLLLGTLASGFVEVFFSRDHLAKLAPRSPVGGVLFGSFLGIGFPVCECGVVPLTRCLMGKVCPFTWRSSFSWHRRS